MEDAAHRKDDVAISLVEVAMSTLRHQHQLHFLQGLEEYAGILPPPSLQPPSLLLGTDGGRAVATALRGRWPTQHRPAALTGSLPLIPLAPNLLWCPSRVLLVHP